ncbi:MAG: DUF1631 family protein [Usitatibacter sp.]
MSQPSGSNVVPFAPAARQRLSPRESASVLRGCRELALDRMGRALSGMLDRVEDELLALAGAAPDRAERDAYLDAGTEARDKRSLIESTFRQHFLDCFNRKVRGEEPMTQGAGEGAPTPDPEESLAVDAMSRKLQAACEGELGLLGRRMGFLLERPELAADANPVSPATVCSALRDACDQIESGLKARVALFNQLEQHAEAELRHIYHDLNAHLVERSILPDAIVAPDGAATQRMVALRHSDDATQPLVALRQPGDATQPVDLFAALVQLSRGSACAPEIPAAAIMGELTRMQRESAEVGSGTLVNELRTLPAFLHDGKPGTLDARTIDLVAMLFDALFADRHLPTSMKEQLGRLQLPILKAVLLDAGFFSDRRQAARRLLDALGDLGIGFAGDAVASRAAMDLVRDVVHGILADFDTGMALFASMAAMVETFIAANEEADAHLVRRASFVVEARERRDSALAAGVAEVARRLGARGFVPAPVREMLVEEWVHALADVYLTEGEGAPQWHRLVQAMEDLLWSVEPKAAAADRRRLIASLPMLIAEVGDGLARANTPAAKRVAFLAALVDCHALAIKAGLRGMAAVPEFAAPREAKLANPIVREMLTGGDVRVENFGFRIGHAAVVGAALMRTGAWSHVQRGTWVEFSCLGGPPARARLSWVSPGKGAYLFTNPLTGATAVSISPEALAEQMRLGVARMLNDAPLVGRAMDAMIAELRGRTAGARNPSP